MGRKGARSLGQVSNGFRGRKGSGVHPHKFVVVFQRIKAAAFTGLTFHGLYWG